jgi:O-antigen/teichoic acid export membrane protein
MQKRYKKLFTDTGLFAISNFGSKILTFLLVPLYTSVLSTEEYGSVDIITTTVNLLYPVLTLSIFDATLRFALDKKYDNKAVFSTSMLLTGVASVILLIATPFLKGTDNLFGQYWWFFVGIFVTSALQMCLSNYIKGCDKTKIFAIQGILYTVVFLLLNIWFLLFLKIGLKGYLLSMIIACAASCLYMLLASKCYSDLVPFTIDKKVCKEMLSYSVPMILTSIAWWINASADKYMILGLVGVGANGLYGVAHKIPTIFSTFSNLFSQAWRISAISTYDEADKQAYYSKVYKVYSLICIYGCLILTFASQLIAKILFKADFYQAWMLVPPLVLAALFEAYAGFLASTYAAAKKTKFLSISTCIGAVVNIILNFALIKAIGTIGAPIATMLSFVVVWLMRLKVMRSFMPIKMNIGKSISSVFIVIISGLYYAFQGPYKYISGAIAIAAIVIINLQDTKNLLGFVHNTVRGVTHKHTGGN